MYGSPFYPQVTTPRSAIPRVIGIIAVIFSVIGFGASLLFTFGPLSDLDRSWDSYVIDGSTGRQAHYEFMTNWLYLWCVLSTVLFLVHLVGGILALVYRTIGLRLLTAYAVSALVLVVVDLVVIWAFHEGIGRIKNSVSIPHTLFDAIAVVWPVIVLVLVNLRRAKQACT